MLHYAETARSSTTIPLLPVPGSHQPERNTDPHPALAQQGTLDWTTDEELTQLIAQELPTTLPTAAIAPWKRGFIFGWCMTWYYQPFLNEAAEADEEAEMRAAPAPWKRRKSTHSSVPKYPNALRACLKQAGYSFREVSRETAIPESTLYSWASGKQVIPHASREQLAHVIGCAVEELAPTRMAV